MKSYLSPIAISFIVLLLMSVFSLPFFSHPVQGQQTLIINAPSSVLEGDVFSVSVLTGGGLPIGFASVTFNGDIHQTGINGFTSFTAPEVTVDTIFLLRVTHPNYQNRSVNITVKNNEPLLNLQLTIVAPTSVNESDTVTITVKYINTPVKGVTVKFAGMQDTTNAAGVVLFTSPHVDEDTLFQIFANKTGYLDGSAVILVMNSEPITESKLTIVAPDSAEENTLFVVTVFFHDVLVPSATVSFKGQLFSTDDNGSVEITAPPVDQDNEYIIIASKDGFLSNFTVIIITNSEESYIHGWISGRITDIDNAPIDQVHITIMDSDEQLLTVVQTTSEGTYNVTLSPDSYLIKINKTGYSTQILYGIQVSENRERILNAVLEKIMGESSVPSYPLTSQDAVIQWATESGTVAASVIITSELTKSMIYTNDLTLNLLQANHSLTCTVSAPQNTTQTIIIIRLGNTEDLLGMPMHELDSLQVDIDGNTITQADYFEQVFPATADPLFTPRWAVVVLGQEIVIAINIIHFSEHSITIRSLPEIVEPFTGITGIFTYIFIAVFAAIFFIGIGEITKRM
ncbi:MAG: carboxypeptidase regulatory-like domain-containing protein [Methanobacteriota archaeon]